MISSTSALRQAILQLEKKQDEKGLLLKEQFNITYNRLKPINLIKNVFREVVSAPDLTGRIVNSAMGMGAGYVIKKIVFGGSRNPIKKIFGLMLELGVIDLVKKNPEAIKSSGMQMIKRLLRLKSTSIFKEM